MDEVSKGPGRPVVRHAPTPPGSREPPPSPNAASRARRFSPWTSFSTLLFGAAVAGNGVALDALANRTPPDGSVAGVGLAASIAAGAGGNAVFLVHGWRRGPGWPLALVSAAGGLVALGAHVAILHEVEWLDDAAISWVMFIAGPLVALLMGAVAALGAALQRRSRTLGAVLAWVPGLVVLVLVAGTVATNATGEGGVPAYGVVGVAIAGLGVVGLSAGASLLALRSGRPVKPLRLLLLFPLAALSGLFLVGALYGLVELPRIEREIEEAPTSALAAPLAILAAIGLLRFQLGRRN